MFPVPSNFPQQIPINLYHLAMTVASHPDPLFQSHMDYLKHIFQPISKQTGITVNLPCDFAYPIPRNERMNFPRTQKNPYNLNKYSVGQVRNPLGPSFFQEITKKRKKFSVNNTKCEV